MFSRQNVRNLGSVLCMLVLLFVGDRAMAQADQNSANAEATATAESTEPAAAPADSKPLPPEKLPPSSPQVQYTDQLLKIDAFNSTLADILAKVAALTGADIDVPAGARGERMVADLGPGPPRQILTSLLTDTDFDFVIISSKGDPQSILTVLLTPRGHNNGSARDTVLAERPAPNFRGIMRQQSMPVAESSADSQPADDSANSGSDGASADAAASAGAPSDSPVAAASLSGAPDTGAAGAPAPARVPDSSSGQGMQNMNQQLLQMYKQREQQIQEQRTSGRPGNP